MNNSLIIVLVCSIPLILGIILFIVFKRAGRNEQNDSVEIIKEQEELQRLSGLAEFKEAQIVSVKPEDQSGSNPGERIVKFRFAVKTGENKHVTLRARWKIDNIYMSNFRQGKIIQIKIYDKYVFPAYPGAKLIPDSVRS